MKSCALPLVALIVSLIALGVNLWEWRNKPIPEPLEPIVKETIIHDTIRLEKPVYLTISVVDTIYLPITEVVVLKDSSCVALPIEVAEYRDSSYYARISGYRPRLDYIETYATTVTKEVQSRWTFGFQAGFGLLAPIGNEVGFGGYVGYGVGVRF